jgi:hypothetical protein
LNMRGFKVRLVFSMSSHANRLHNLYLGTSKIALDVFAGVTSEYLFNVGRTFRFLCDKYSQKMTPEVLFSDIFTPYIPSFFDNRNLFSIRYSKVAPPKSKIWNDTLLMI